MKRYLAYCGLYCGACWSMICRDKQEGVESAVELHTMQTNSPAEVAGISGKANVNLWYATRLTAQSAAPSVRNSLAKG